MADSNWIARLLQLLLLIVSLEPCLTATQDSTTSTDAADTAATPGSSQKEGTAKVVSIFYIDERAYEGLPYTLFHRDSGSVIGVDADQTTYVITTTRVDQRPAPTHGSSSGVNITTTTIASGPPSIRPNATGEPSTITQGPATFVHTGTQYGPRNTVVNRCSLNGTVSAVCALTRVGSAWYATDTEWNGTFSTYHYSWSSGASGGFAPVTITRGAELIQAVAPTATPSSNAASMLRPQFVGDGCFLTGGFSLFVAGLLGTIFMM